MKKSGYRFKPGDRIIRLKEDYFGNTLFVGCTYEVEADIGEYIRLVGFKSSWYKELFELVEPKKDKEFEDLWV